MAKIAADTIGNTINNIFDEISNRHPDITDKCSKTGGISLYVSNRKILQISENTRDRIEFLILRDSDKNYCRPQFEGLDIRNIRKYDPTQASYIRPWGYMFYRVLVTIEQYSDNKNVLNQLIDNSYEIGKEEKILKVSKSDHEQLAPIFEGTYIFEENDEVETSRAESLDTGVKYSDPAREEVEEVATEKHDLPLSGAILSEDRVDVVESKDVSSIDEKKIVTNETDPNRRIFNYINNDPEKIIAILDKIEISLFLELIKKDDIPRLESLYSLLSKNKIPEEYVTALIENRISVDNFEKLISCASSHDKNPTYWPQFDFVMDCYKAFNKDITKAANELKSVETKAIPNDKWGIKTKRLLELLQYPITPILDMTMGEAEIIFGYPSSDKEDVMKTKTVVTWKYLKPSNKMDRDIEALELKFRDSKLERYIDKRDNTSWDHNLEPFRDSAFDESSNTKEVLMLFMCMHSLFEGDLSNNYQKCEDQCFKKVMKDTLTNINRCKSQIIKKKEEYKSTSSYSKERYKGYLDNAIQSGERLLEAPCKVRWDENLFPLTDFSRGKELYTNKINEISSKKDIIESLADLKNTMKSGCYIATATMGDLNHPTVLHLREFRDLFLLKRSWGVSFIRYYYHYCPYPARIIAKSPILKFASYWVLIKPLTIITKRLLGNKIY